MIHVGIGGWTFEPWRGVFYPKGLVQARELEFASRALTSIEVNGTFYGTQKRDSFARWAAETPDGFVFSLKAPRFAVNRRVLADAGPSIERFVAGGVDALGDKLGPVLWQFAATKAFEPEDLARFVALLPARAGDVPLRHALEVRHPSFETEAFLAIARNAGAAVVFADSDRYPSIDASTADFHYARLQMSEDANTTGYTETRIDHWAAQAITWGRGGKDVFVYFISGAKVRNPAAAMALIARIGRNPANGDNDDQHL